MLKTELIIYWIPIAIVKNPTIRDIATMPAAPNIFAK